MQGQTGHRIRPRRSEEHTGKTEPLRAATVKGIDRAVEVEIVHVSGKPGMLEGDAERGINTRVETDRAGAFRRNIHSLRLRQADEHEHSEKPGKSSSAKVGAHFEGGSLHPRMIPWERRQA